MRYLARPLPQAAVLRALRRAPVVALIGPRQSGKTTLARHLHPATRQIHRFDLENPADQQALAEPMQALGPLRGLVIIDEIQAAPKLFPVLRVLADRRPLPARFLLLGSASGKLLQSSAESLAGRIETVELQGFRLDELPDGRLERLWLRGGFPRSLLADSEANSRAWRDQFIRTFLERDLPQLGVSIPAAHLHRLWSMLAHHHGQIANFTEISRSLDLTDTTVRRQIDLLLATFMLRLLPPWHANLGKRLVKSPKLYIRDSGLFHALQRIPDRRELLRHPKLGASWEGFALEQVLSRHPGFEAHFYATHGGAELDLLLSSGERRWGIEFKFADAPTLTRSMHQSLQDLRLERLFVLYPGDRRYALSPEVEVWPLGEFLIDSPLPPAFA